ncbi:MAG: hypothetical protein MHM6MM_002842 [Cercozoa sp. M6MM]
MAAVSAGHARRYTARLTQSLWPEYDAPTSSDSKKKKKKSPHEFRYSPFTSRRSLNRDIHDYSSQYDDLCAFDENELSVRVTSSSMSHEDVFSHLLYPPVESTSTPTPVTGDDKIPLQSYRHSSSSSSSSSTCAALPVRKSPTVTVTAPVNSRHRMATPVSVGTPTVADILQGRCEHPPVRHKSGGFRYSTFTDIPRELHSCRTLAPPQYTRSRPLCRSHRGEPKDTTWRVVPPMQELATSLSVPLLRSQEVLHAFLSGVLSTQIPATCCAANSTLGVPALPWNLQLLLVQRRRQTASRRSRRACRHERRHRQRGRR